MEGFFFLEKEKGREPRNSKETFGFKTANKAPTINELAEFERRLVRMVTEIQFREGGEIRSKFQEKLSQDLDKKER